MKLNLPTRDNETAVAVALIRSGRPWLGYSLVLLCRFLTSVTVAGLAILAWVSGRLP